MTPDINDPNNCICMIINQVYNPTTQSCVAEACGNGIRTIS